MRKKFDLVVIGTGSAASTAASKCRAAGWSVAVVDSRPFGGTCALRGCDPKKVLVGAAALIDWVRRMESTGDNARIEWPELMRFKRTFTDPVSKQREKSFAEAGIETFHGSARFTGPTNVQVGEDVLEGRHVLIATGAKPQKLNIPGEEHLTTSEQFLELDSLPRRIVFVGGGYISFEFAHISVRCGAKVTLLHRGERPLERFEPLKEGGPPARSTSPMNGCRAAVSARAKQCSGPDLADSPSSRTNTRRIPRANCSA